MQVHHDLSHLPVFRNAVVTIGTFDGVHLGHQIILSGLKKEAEAVNGETVVVTFHPHPRKILASAQGPLMLNTLEEKTERLAQLGIHHLVVAPFNEAFAAITARSYVEDFLVKTIQPHTLIIGYDHHFGRNREGNFHLLNEYAEKGAFRLVQVNEQVIEEIAVSSTRIRKALTEGNTQLATHLLGYDYFFSGEVVHGNKKGRTIGFPTANLQLDDADKLLPGNGVYVVTARLNNETLQGMMNIGYRPTVGGNGLVVEVHLLHFNREIYGEILTVEVKERLRSEQKFGSFDELKTQLETDRNNTIAWFSRQ